MKTLFGIFLVLISIGSQAGIFETLQQCANTCSAECAQLTARLKNEIAYVDTRCAHNPYPPGPNPGPYPPGPNPPSPYPPSPYPPSYGSVRLFSSSDSCRSGFLTAIDSHSNCDEMARYISGGVWSVEVNGRCMDISDTNFLTACILTKDSGSPMGVELFGSDSCSSNYVTTVTRFTNCEDLRRVGARSVWGVRSQGRCMDVSDTDLVQACYRYRQM